MYKVEVLDMRQVIIKASELNKNIDFVPTVVFGFYCETDRGTFLKTAEKIKECFGDIIVIACSSSGNVFAKVPYRTNETVLCLMNLDADAVSLYFSNDKDEVRTPPNDNNVKRDALLFYAGGGSWIQEGLQSLQEQLFGGTFFGAVTGTLNTQKSGSLYYDGKFYEEGVLGCLIDTAKYELKGSALHDFEPAGIELLITEAEGNTIIQIEDEPALSMIERIIGTITPKRMAMYDTPFFIKNSMSNQKFECSLMSLQSIDRTTETLSLSHDIQVGSILKVAIPISNKTMQRRLLKMKNSVLPRDKKGAAMFFLSSSSLPSHWHEMEVLYMMKIINQVDIPFMGLHTFGEIAPLANHNHSILRDQTLTVVSISKRSTV